MAYVVVYDACVLYPNTLRDLLIRVAQPGLVQAKWTHQILDEVDRALVRNLNVPADKIAALRSRMNDAVRDCIVTGYEPLVEALRLPDPDDRHVLAAAIKAGAQGIITSNLRDFPTKDLAVFGIEAKSADEYVMDLIGLDDRIVYSCAQAIATSRRQPPATLDDVFGQLERSGLIESVTALRSRPSPG